MINPLTRLYQKWCEIQGIEPNLQRYTWFLHDREKWRRYIRCEGEFTRKESD